MLPADLQDYVFQWSDGKSTYEEMWDPIISMAINRVSMSKLVPMEGTRRSTTMRVTGSRSRKNSWKSVTWESRAGSVEELVTAPESAPLPKGRGKELGSQISNRTTKGSQRGRRSQTTRTSAKAKAKAKGRLFDGECWSCGERGHRAQHCQKGKSVTNIESVEEEQETYVGGVWSIAHVEAETVDAGWKGREGPRDYGVEQRKDINEERTINAVPVESSFKPVGEGEKSRSTAPRRSLCVSKNLGERLIRYGSRQAVCSS